MFETRTTLELQQIAAAGGGFTFKASTRTTLELCQIAASAKRSGARITFTGLGTRPTPELLQIAAAGGGTVVFSD